MYRRRKGRRSHQTSLVPRLDIALAVVAALRTARRAVARGLGLVAGAGFVAAGALHQDAATLAVGDHAPLGGRFFGFTIIGFRGPTRHRPVEIGACEFGDLLAKL